MQNNKQNIIIVLLVILIVVLVIEGIAYFYHATITPHPEACKSGDTYNILTGQPCPGVPVPQASSTPSVTARG